MAGTASNPVIMDVDTGVDDAIAIALATRLPELDLIGVTTVAGNVDVAKTTENSLRVLAALGRSDVPVYRGMSRPLARAYHDAAEYHGVSGLGDAEFPPSPVGVQAETAPEFIVRTARERPGEITLIPVAPLTNIAVALALEPELPRLVKRVVIMGGAFLCPGNVTTYAEYNIWADPEAAAIVANSALPITFIGLDVTHKAPLERSLWETLAGSEGVEAKMVYDLCRRTFVGRGRSVFPLHDPLAVAVSADPELVTTEAWGVTVETGIDEWIGRTTLVQQPDAARHQVAVKVRTEDFLARVRQALSLG
ncbi:MAG TPA: nucleoside hydrolase [Nitrolancea sp.]|nr:nucleoside hydrolase [Nitrolancea sp.]